MAFYLAVWAGKLTAWLSRLGKRRGSSLPGKVALAICPRLLQVMSQRLRRGIVMVTGTNGKTTTNNMAGAVFKEAGYHIIINREGANLISGVATSFVLGASLWGKIKADFALLEVDEASVPVVTRHVKPDLLVVTNFFRDQLDRYGELDKTVAHVKKALKNLPDTGLVLNADDPLVAQLAHGRRQVIFFGLTAGARGEPQARTREARFCPFCGQELEYLFYHYSQLGSYRCPACNFARPHAAVEGEGVLGARDGFRFDVRWRGTLTEVKLRLPGFYNVYNALAAFGMGVALNVPGESIARGIEFFSPAVGRMESFLYRGKPVYLNLVKNPTGFNESLVAMLDSGSEKDIFIAINDNDADGRDISWLWDVDFEVLEREFTCLGFTCAGARAEEMALRLKYAGVPPDHVSVASSLAGGIKRALDGPGRVVYLFSTYTALWQCQKELMRFAQKRAAGEEAAVGS